jgi:DNA (cytosine-5)-methyltransferase 1
LPLVSAIAPDSVSLYANSSEKAAKGNPQQMLLVYGSVCSGIEAASVAWDGLGFVPSFFSEIDPGPRAVLEAHFPDVPVHGDFTSIGAEQYEPINLLVGGTPCQSFSTSGLRKGMDDSRGVLALEFLRLAQRKRPRWVVWENVPGVLSIHKGRAFAAFLSGLAECGYGFAYRVLDAQFFGVPQKRRRVFVVGHSGANWQRAGAVLFERESLFGYPSPPQEGPESLNGRSVPASIGSGRDQSQVPLCGEIAPTLDAQMDAKWGSFQWTKQKLAVAIMAHGQANAEIRTDGISPTLTCLHEAPILATPENLRRFTPLECERIMGFPDNHTAVPWKRGTMPDGRRYKMLGNSMAVPVMRWLGERIRMVDALEA